MAAGAVNAQPWGRAVFEDVTLEYRLVGSGDAVVFIHGGVFADGLAPLSSAPALVARHRVLTWRRVGYARSGPAAGHADIESQAAQLAQLMQRLDLPRAHVVGHSSGGLIALQFALDHPDRVQSLVLLEPALSIPGVEQSRHRTGRAQLSKRRPRGRDRCLHAGRGRRRLARARRARAAAGICAGTGRRPGFFRAGVTSRARLAIRRGRSPANSRSRRSLSREATAARCRRTGRRARHSCCSSCRMWKRTFWMTPRTCSPWSIRKPSRPASWSFFQVIEQENAECRPAASGIGR